MTFRDMKLTIIMIICLIFISGCSMIEQIAEFNLEQIDVAQENEEEVVLLLPESTYVKNEIELAMENPNSFNPLDEIPYSVDQVLKLVYEPLFSINQNFEPVNQIASDYTKRQEKVYRITLRSDVVFHNGLPLTAQDVVYSLNYIRNNAESPYSYAADYIETLSIVSDYVLDVKFKKEHWFNKYSLTFPILSKEYVESEEYDSMNPVGTGPYQIDEFQNMLELSLIYNINYYESYNFFDRIIISIVRSDFDNYNMFISKRIDIFYPEQTLWNEFSEESNLTINKYISPYYYYIGINHNQYYLSDLKARQYLATLIPYGQIAKEVFLNHLKQTGLPILPQISLIAQGDPYYLTNTENTYYNMYLKEGAQEENLLNWRGETDLQNLPVTIPYVTDVRADIRLLGIYNKEDPIQVHMIELMETSIQSPVLNIQWTGYDADTYLLKLEMVEFDVFLGCYTTSFISDVDELIGSNGIYNYGKFKSLNVNGLLGTYMSMDNENQMISQMENLAHVITDELPYIPIGFLENGVFIHDQVTGILFPTYFNIYNDIYNIKPLEQ